MKYRHAAPRPVPVPEEPTCIIPDYVLQEARQFCRLAPSLLPTVREMPAVKAVRP